jgi:hypothetical protein
MADDKKFNGFTVSELESRVKKYGLEICMCAVFILTAIFTLAWGGSMLLWSILLSMIFGIIGAIFPKPVKKTFHSTLEFIYKEKVTCIAAAVISILASIFLPVVIFALVGLIAGKSIALHASACCSENCDTK